MTTETRATIGVDVGATKTAVARLDGTTLADATIEPTDLSDADALLAQVARMVDAAGPADAVGVGVPSVVDDRTGVARASVRVPLRDVPVGELLHRRLGDAMPVAVVNDGQAAALGEAHDDALAPLPGTLVLVAVGTGVGGGIVSDGRLLTGATGAAGHLGHMLIGAELASGSPAHRPDPPQPGTVEELCSGTALDRLAVARGYRDGSVALEAARAGEPAARAAIERLATGLGVAVAGVINLLDPDAIVLGGGVAAAAGNLLLEPVARCARRFALEGCGTATTVRLARYGALAGVRGAALLARAR